MSRRGSLAPICFDCQFYQGVKVGVGYTCQAFGEKKSIPILIAVSAAIHTEPYPGDNGIQFEPIDTSADAGKATKAEADYIDNADAEFCRDCTMFREFNQCTAVEGDISPDGHCRFFERADSYSEDSILSRFYGL